ncbi:hypothetical protein [Microbacterium oleivorans]|uniref:Uncharacterized protein n=1 Tax=Microbacterium oleivorans TaxID=273677 RepID=A0A7D5F7B7_9MICO|nr:hypothetical protein [Microbacterium oleivorans]QLD10769.1 hypothetical protein HW566_02610 [Microbacterium oleivorans]
MDRVHYAGDSVLTGSDIARALLDYAQALAEAGTAATVDIPVVDDDGAEKRWEVLVGPASQMTALAADWSGPEVRDDLLVARLRENARHVRARGGGAAAPVAADDEHVGGVAQPWSGDDAL